MRALRPVVPLLVVVAPRLVAPACLPAQQLTLERLWSAGSAYGSEAETWARLEDATVVDGYVIAVDLFLPTVRAFTVEGDFVGELGGIGAGPGEYSGPISVAAVDRGFEVWDLDQSRSIRWTISDRGIRHDSTSFSWLPSLVWMRDVRGGGTVGWTGMYQGRGKKGESDSRHFVLMVKDDRVDTLAAVDGNPFFFVLGPDPDMPSAKADGKPVPDTKASPFAGGGAWFLGDSLLVVVNGWTNRADLYRMGTGGPSPRRTVTPPTRSSVRASSSSDEEKLERWWLDREGLESLDGKNRDQDAVQVERIIMPDSVPVWSKVVGDDQGNIWLRDGSVEHLRTEQGERWLRWNLADDTYTWLDVPRGVEVLRFRQGYMVGREVGELGVHGLVLFRLVES